MPITTVVFDVGETLVDETRHWSEWADWMGVPRLTFFAAMGVVIERRLHHTEVFQLLRPGYDREAEARRRQASGWAYHFEPNDFYPDALPCLTDLRSHGYRIGIAGNQPEVAEEALRQGGRRGRLYRILEPLGRRKTVTRLLRQADRGVPSARRRDRLCRRSARQRCTLGARRGHDSRLHPPRALGSGACGLAGSSPSASSSGVPGRAQKRPGGARRLGSAAELC